MSKWTFANLTSRSIIPCLSFPTSRWMMGSRSCDVLPGADSSFALCPELKQAAPLPAEQPLLAALRRGVRLQPRFVPQAGREACLRSCCRSLPF